ncbi:MAG: hypothetical protein ACLQBD_16365 [Syntrophobacteraceae bacterium]
MASQFKRLFPGLCRGRLRALHCAPLQLFTPLRAFFVPPLSSPLFEVPLKLIEVA